MIDPMDAYHAAQQAADQKIGQAVADAAKVARIDEVTTTVQFVLKQPLVLDLTHGGPVEITRVKASTTVFPNPQNEDQEGEPYTQVEGYAYTLTKAGKRSQKDRPVWRTLPGASAMYLVALGIKKAGA
jgi:hypothetical protein